MFNRFRTKAATLLQKSYRLQLQIKRCRRERKTILDAAGVIQQVVRGWVARRVVSRKREHRRMDRAAATLQRVMWGHVCRRKEHRRKVAAAVTLWTFMGGLSVKLSQMRKRRKRSAATRIQSAFRVRRSRLRLSALRARRRGIMAASKIQAVTRGHRTRVKTRVLHVKRRKETAACTIIQAAFRGHVSREKTKGLLLERREGSAVTAIQAFFRGRRSRMETRNRRARRRAAATRIQSLFLHQRWKRRELAFRRERDRSALIVQRSWKKSRRSGKVKLAQEKSNTPGMNNVRRGSASVIWASSKTQQALDYATLDRANLQLVLQALAVGVVTRVTRTPSEARQLRKEVALPEDDPTLESLLCQRLSGLETALAASSKFVGKPTETPPTQGRNGEKALLESLRVLEAGLRRPSD